LPVGGQSLDDLMEAALLSSFADDTPEGKKYHRTYPGKDRKSSSLSGKCHFHTILATTRVSGAQLGEVTYLKGASDAITKFVLSAEYHPS